MTVRFVKHEKFVYGDTYGWKIFRAFDCQMFNLPCHLFAVENFDDKISQMNNAFVSIKHFSSTLYWQCVTQVLLTLRNDERFVENARVCRMMLMARRFYSMHQCLGCLICVSVGLQPKKVTQTRELECQTNAVPDLKPQFDKLAEIEVTNLHALEGTAFQRAAALQLVDIYVPSVYYRRDFSSQRYHFGSN